MKLFKKSKKEEQKALLQKVEKTQLASLVGGGGTTAVSVTPIPGRTSVTVGPYKDPEDMVTH